MFPPKGSGGDPLGTPPPSPTGMNPDGMGNVPFSMRGMAGGMAQVPTNQLPPEMLQGITAASMQINTMLDSFAQATPNEAALLDAVKSALQQYLAAIAQAGIPPVSPTASGAAFPGGGLARGIAGPGAV